MSKNLQPEIRFKGFNDNWEVKHFFDVINYKNGKAHESEVDKDGDYVIINSKFISSDGVIRKYTNTQLEPVYSGDITFVLSDVPNGKALAKVFLVDIDDLYTLNQRIAGFTPKDNYDSNFLTFLINRNKYFLQFDNGVGQTNLSLRDIAEFSENYPGLIEQQKIGDFFQSMDKNIALQEEKLSKTKNLKKAMLEKMFPKEGSKLPEVRFDGFSGDWRLVSIVDVAEIVGGGTPDTNYKEYWGGDINWYSPTEIGDEPYVYDSSKKITELGMQKSSARMLPADKTILFTSRAGIGDMAILKKPAATNQGFQSFIVNNADVYFIYSMGFKIKKYALANASGSTFLEISKKELELMMFFIPEIDEQEKIGNYFKELDKAIVLQSEQLEKLKNIKKAYLTKMFV